MTGQEPNLCSGGEHDLTEGAPDPHTEGAIKMARYWVRNAGQIGDTPYPQLCRELYTISRALVRLANQRGVPS